MGIGFILCALLLKSCLLQKGEFVIIYLMVLIHFEISVLLAVLLVVSQCFLVLGRQLPEAKSCTEIRESTFGLTKRLAQTAQETFGDFEEAVEKDATKTAVLDGTVHPLTSYVINSSKNLKVELKQVHN